MIRNILLSKKEEEEEVEQANDHHPGIMRRRDRISESLVT